MEVDDENHRLDTRRLKEFGHLAGGVGHHVINAFSAIVSNAELLRSRRGASSSVDFQQIVESLVRTSLEASAVARRLIDLSRPITFVDQEDVDLSALISEFIRSDEWGRPEYRVRGALAEVPLIRGSRADLTSMLTLLSTNAREAITKVSDEPVIEYATSVDERGWVVVEVRDRGCGMSPEVLERAVEPFFTTKPGRNGIGLSIANGIWRRHGGTLSIRSRPDGGCVIRLCVEPKKS